MNRRYRRSATAPATLLALAAGLLLGAKSPGQDWPQFRGIERDGASAETGLLDHWPEGGPRQVWRVKLGDGYSSISAVAGRLYTMFAADHEGQPTEFAAAFDAATGKELWRTAIGKRFDNEFGNGPRATPTVAGDTVYVLGALGDLAALATENGTLRWKVNLTDKFGTAVPTFGFATSALVDGDQVVIEAGGGEGKSYAALDRKTGEVKWTAGNGGPDYSSPVAVTRNGTTRYVYFGGGKLNCIDAQGQAVWSHDWPRGETAAMPLFIAPDRIFGAGAEGVGAHLFKITDADGTQSVERQWESGQMRIHFNAGVRVGDHIYAFDNATLKCIAVEDGALAWAKRGLGKGSLIQADGALYVLTDDGRLLLVEATPAGYREKGSVQALEGRSWTAPSLSGGTVYLRNYTEMVAYDVKG